MDRPLSSPLGIAALCGLGLGLATLAALGPLPAAAVLCAALMPVFVNRVLAPSAPDFTVPVDAAKEAPDGTALSGLMTVLHGLTEGAAMENNRTSLELLEHLMDLEQSTLALAQQASGGVGTAGLDRLSAQYAGARKALLSDVERAARAGQRAMQKAGPDAGETQGVCGILEEQGHLLVGIGDRIGGLAADVARFMEVEQDARARGQAQAQGIETTLQALLANAQCADTIRQQIETVSGALSEISTLSQEGSLTPERIADLVSRLERAYVMDQQRWAHRAALGGAMGTGGDMDDQKLELF